MSHLIAAVRMDLSGSEIRKRRVCRSFGVSGLVYRCAKVRRSDWVCCVPFWRAVLKFDSVRNEVLVGCVKLKYPVAAMRVGSGVLGSLKALRSWVWSCLVWESVSSLLR